MSVKSLIYQKRTEILKITKKYGVIKIQLFGSVAREEESRDSDIDFLIKFEEGRSLFDLISLKCELHDLLNMKVDVVTEDALHWNIRENIKSEVVEV